MTRDQLIAHTRHALRMEEDATAAYLTHLNSLIERTDADPKTIAQFQRIVSWLKRENDQHAAILRQILAELKESKCHDY